MSRINFDVIPYYKPQLTAIGRNRHFAFKLKSSRRDDAALHCAELHCTALSRTGIRLALINAFDHS